MLTHAHLLREVWGPGSRQQHHYLRVYMAQLRHKLEADPSRPAPADRARRRLPPARSLGVRPRGPVLSSGTVTSAKDAAPEPAGPCRTPAIVLTLLALTLTQARGAQAAPPSAPAPSGADSAAVDTIPPPRITRVFDEFIVRAKLDDIGSSRTVRPLTAATLARLPIDGLRDAVALQAGVVAQGGELHVRGGRVGDASVVVSGVPLADPLRDRPFELPLLAVERAELVSGGLGGRDGGTIAGVLDVRTVSPRSAPRPRSPGRARPAPRRATIATPPAWAPP